MGAPSASATGSNHSTGTTGTNTPTFTLPGSGVLAGIGVVAISTKSNSFSWSSLPSGWSVLWSDSNGNGNDTLTVLSGPISAGQSGALNFQQSVTTIWSLTWALVPNGLVVAGNALTNANSANTSHNQTDDNPSPYAECLVLLHLGGRASTTSQTSQTAISSAPSPATIQAQCNTGASTNNMICGVATDTTSATGTTSYTTWVTGGSFFSVSAITLIANQPQTVSPSAIASGEAIGSATISVPGQTVSPTAIASSEAFGTATISTGPVTVSPSGIASAEAFGTAKINQTIYAIAIAGAEAFGTAVVSPGPVTVSPTAIASAEAFGSTTILYKIFQSMEFGVNGDSPTSGNASDGSTAFDYSNTNTGTITVATASQHLGTRSLKAVTTSGGFIAMAGWTSAKIPGGMVQAYQRTYFTFAITQPNKSQLFQWVGSSGVVGAVALQNTGAIAILSSSGAVLATSSTTLSAGQHRVEALLDLTTPSAAVITVKIFAGANVEGATPDETFSCSSFSTSSTATTDAHWGLSYPGGLGAAGTIWFDDMALSNAGWIGPLVPPAQTVSPSGIASGEAFGSVTVSSRNTVSPTAISSAEAFGVPVLSVGPVTVSVSGIASGEAFGSATLSPGPVTVSPTGIGSAESFGTAVLTNVFRVSPTAIASGEAFGTAVLTSLATISPSGVASAEAFGAATVSSHYTISPTAIGSAEAFGNPTVSVGPVTISPTGISSAETFGATLVSTGVVSISPPGIASGEAFGTTKINQTVYAVAIAGAEAFGTAVLTPGNTTISPVGIASGEAFGTTAVGIVFFHSFEGGASGSSVLSSAPTDGSSQFDISQVTGASATITIDTAWSHLGTRSFKSLVAGDTAASAGYSSSVIGSLSPHVVARVYARWTGNVPDHTRFFTLRDSGGGWIAPRMNSDGSIDVVDPQTGTPMSGSLTGSVPVTGTHVARVEVHLDITTPSAPVMDVWVWVDGNVETASTASADAHFLAIGSATHSVVNSLYLGLTYPSGQNPTFTLWLDDFAIRGGSGQALIGPLVPPAQNISVNSIPSGEAFGTPVLTPKNTISTVGQIASAEAFGTPVVNSLKTLFPAGIGSNEFFGTTIVSPGATVLLPVGIASAEALGVPVVNRNGFVAPQGIVSAEAFGAVVVIPGPVSISGAGAIASAESFGVPALHELAVVTAFGIPSAEAFGLALVVNTQLVIPVGIASAEAFGHPDLLNQNFADLLIHMFDPVVFYRMHEPITIVERMGPATSGTAMGPPRAYPA